MRGWVVVDGRQFASLDPGHTGLSRLVKMPIILRRSMFIPVLIRFAIARQSYRRRDEATFWVVCPT